MSSPPAASPVTAPPAVHPDETVLGRMGGRWRFFLAAVTMLSASVFFFSTSCLGLLMGKTRGRAWMLQQTVYWGKTVLWGARCPLEVTFDAPLPTGGYFVFANHQSILDIPALFVAMAQAPLTFAVKRELFSVPFWGWYMRMAGFVEVDRRNLERAKESYGRAAVRVRTEGLRVGVYPEGTRSVDGSVLPFKKGAFVLAIDAQSPIVPLAIEGAQQAVRKFTFRLYGCPIRIIFGVPISTVGLTHADRESLLIRTRTAILELHQRVGAAASPVEPMIAPPGKRSGLRDEA